MSTLTPEQYQRIKDQLTEREREAVERELGLAPAPPMYYKPLAQAVATRKAERLVEEAKAQPEPVAAPQPPAPPPPAPSLAEPTPAEAAPDDQVVGTRKIFATPSGEELDLPYFGKVRPPEILSFAVEEARKLPGFSTLESTIPGIKIKDVDVTADELKELVKKQGKEELETLAETKIDAASRQLGRDLTEEEKTSLRNLAAADMEDAITSGRTSTLQRDFVSGPLGEAVTMPGEVSGGIKYNTAQMVNRYASALIDRGIVDWRKANPGKQMTPEVRSEIVEASQDTAKREVFSVVGWTPSRQNAFVPLDPIERQVSKIREGQAPGALGVSPSYLPLPGSLPMPAVKKMYELANGPGTYKDSYHAKVFTPFIASITPGFTQSDVVDAKGKPIGPAMRESWLFSITRSPLTAPFAAYFMGNGVKEWNDDAHLKAIAEGVDLTTVAAPIGKAILSQLPVTRAVVESTGFNEDLAGAMLGTLAVAPVLMVDPDVASMATLGVGGVVSTVAQGARGANRAVAAANAVKADEMVDLLKGAELPGETVLSEPGMEKYLERTKDFIKPASGGFESNESLMIKGAEARAKLRLGAELGSDIAPRIQSAASQAALLEEAESKLRQVAEAVVNDKGALARSLELAESVGKESVAAASKQLAESEAKLQASFQDISAAEQAERRALRMSELSSKARTERAQKSIVTKAEEQVRAAEKPSEKDIGAAREVVDELFDEKVKLQAIEDVGGIQKVVEQYDAAAKVIKQVKEQAAADGKAARQQLEQIRELTGITGTPKRIEQIVEQSATNKKRLEDVIAQIKELEKIPAKAMSEAEAEQLRRLRLARSAIMREAVIDITDGTISNAIESYRTLRAATATNLAKVKQLEGAIAKIADSPKTIQAFRTRIGKASAKTAAASRNMELLLGRLDAVRTRAAQRVEKAKAALEEAKQRAASVKIGPGEAARKLKTRATANVNAAEKALVKANAAFNEASKQYDMVREAPFAGVSNRKLRAVFTDNREALEALLRSSAEQKRRQKQVTALVRYKDILREEYQRLADSYRSYAKWDGKGELPDEVVRAAVDLDTVKMRSADALIFTGGSTFRYNLFDSKLSMRASLMNAFNIARMRTEGKLSRFFGPVAARGFGDLAPEMETIAGRNFGRHRGAVAERNEVAKESMASRKESQRLAIRLAEELKTAPPDRRAAIQSELTRLETRFTKDDYDFLTSTEPIFYGKKGDVTVSNSVDGLSHADRCLEYLKLIESGGNEANDLVVTALARIWMPSGVGPAEAESIEKLARLWLSKTIKESKTGVELVERLRSPRELPFAKWRMETGEVESAMRAWDSMARALIAGSSMRDGVWDMMRATKANLKSSDIAAFDVLASMSHQTLTKDAIEKMIAKGIVDLKELDKTIAKFGSGYTQQAINSWRPIAKGEIANLRLLKLGMTSVGEEVIIPDHVFRAMQEIPERFAKQVTQWDMQNNAMLALWNGWINMRRMNMVYGTWIPKLRNYTVQPIGNWSQAAIDISIGSATRAVASSTTYLLPGVAKDALRYLGMKSGSAMSSLVDSSFERMMRGDKTLILDTAEGPIDGLTFLRQNIEDRYWTSIGSDALHEMRARNMFSDVSKRPWYRKLFEAMYEPNRLVERMADNLEELEKRQRMFLAFELRTGRATGVKVSREAAQKMTLEAMFDWQLGTLPWENEGIFKLFLFHNYRKNAMLRRLGIMKEGIVRPDASHILKAVTGQTRIGRTVTFGQLNATVANAISYEDPNDIVGDSQAFDAWGSAEFPWWMDALSIVAREAMSPEQRRWSSAVDGRNATHSAWVTAPLTPMDDLYVYQTLGMVSAATAVWAYEKAGGRPDVTSSDITEVWLKASRMATDTLMPIVRKHAEALISLGLTGQARQPREVAISRDTALAMNKIGIIFPFVKQNDDGRYVIDGDVAEIFVNLGAEFLPAYQDVIRTIAVTNNPSFNEGLAKGATESMGKLFGLFSRVMYNPSESRTFVEQEKKRKMSEMMREADPFDKK